MSRHQEVRGETWPSHGSCAGGHREPSPLAHGACRHDVRALSRRAQAALPLATVGAGMTQRRVSVSARDVVFVKGVIEASDGLAGVFSERGGELLVAAPRGREDELAELLADLEIELGGRQTPDARASSEGP